jgi:uncharacterized protein (TIGR03083 family)
MSSSLSAPESRDVVDLIVAALAAQQDELDGILRAAADADWDTPTRCPGWTVADVVLHLAQTDELALASTQGRIAEAASSWTGEDGAATVDNRAGALVAPAARGAAAASPGPLAGGRLRGMPRFRHSTRAHD